MSYFAPYLLMTLATLAGAYGIGSLLLRLFGMRPDEPYFDILLRLISGLGVTVGTFAMASTAGVTALLPVPFLLLGVAGVLRKPQSTLTAVVPNGRGQAMLVVVLGAVLLFTLRYFLLYDGASPMLRTPFQDYIFYARLSEHMQATGKESVSLEMLFPQFQGMQPYHYLELWTNALLVRLTGLPALWCLFLSTYTVLIVVVAVGFMAVLVQTGLRGSRVLVIGGLLLLVNGLYLPFFARIPLLANGQLVASSLLLLEPKLAPVYIFLLLAVVLLLKQRYLAVGLTTAMLAPAYTPVAPAMAVGLSVLAIGLLLAGRVRLAGAAAMVLPTVAVAVFLGMLYMLHPVNHPFPEPTTPSFMAGIPPIKMLINIIIGNLINFLVYFGPYLVLTLGLWWARADLRLAWRRPEALVMLAAVLATLSVAVLTRAVAVKLADSFQFSQNVAAPLIPVVLAVILGTVLAGAPRRFYGIAVVGLLLLGVVNHYRLLSGNHTMHKTERFSPAFLTQVQQALTTLPQPARGGFLLADRDYENPHMLSQDTYTAGTYVARYLNGYVLVALSAFDVDSLRVDPRFTRDSAEARQRLQTSSLYRFVRLQHLPLATRADVDSAEVRLVRSYGLRFVCTSARATLPAGLQPLVSRTLHDPWSGENLYLLRPSAGF